MTVQDGNYSNGNPLVQWRYLGSNKFHIVDRGAGNGSGEPGHLPRQPGGQTSNGTTVQRR